MAIHRAEVKNLENIEISDYKWLASSWSFELLRHVLPLLTSKCVACIKNGLLRRPVLFLKQFKKKLEFSFSKVFKQ